MLGTELLFSVYGNPSLVGHGSMWYRDVIGKDSVILENRLDIGDRRGDGGEAGTCHMMDVVGRSKKIFLFSALEGEEFQWVKGE